MSLLRCECKFCSLLAGESGQESVTSITEETVRQIAREEIHKVIWNCGQEITYAVSCGVIDTLLSCYWWRKKRGTPLQDYIIRRGRGVVGSIIGCVTSRMIGHMIVFRIASWVIPRPLLGGVKTVIVLVGGGLMLILADGMLTLIGALGGDWIGATAASKLHRVVAGHLNEPRDA